MYVCMYVYIYIYIYIYIPATLVGQSSHLFEHLDIQTTLQNCGWMFLL